MIRHNELDKEGDISTSPVFFSLNECSRGVGVTAIRLPAVTKGGISAAGVLLFAGRGYNSRGGGSRLDSVEWGADSQSHDCALDLLISHALVCLPHHYKSTLCIHFP